MIKHPITIAGLLLAMFAVVGVGLVAFTHQATKGQIAENERMALLNSLNALVPATSIDNDIVNDKTVVSDIDRLGTEETTVYLGRKAESPVAAVFTSIAPDGYSGQIKLLVAILADGSLGGVRVVAHKETPGLGDKIEVEKGDWIHSFQGKSLKEPAPAKWKVKRDGGIFDQFSGATITPRAIVKAVKNTLLYYDENKKSLFLAKRQAPAKEQMAEAAKTESGK
jgi:Na+-translocating ferredoxin:NAD+ oxidoreductase subunit G